ncbi:hypothetical protein ACTFIW_005909 [Dictyostelium discoideum]
MDNSGYNEINKVLIIDNGSGYIKSGFNNEINLERIQKTPTVIGDARFKSIMMGMGKKSDYIGLECYQKSNKGILDLREDIIVNGIIKDWDGIEKLWEHILFDNFYFDNIEDEEQEEHDGGGVGVGCCNNSGSCCNGNGNGGNGGGGNGCGGEVPILITESLNNPRENRERMAQILFEKFSIPSLYIVNQPLLSYYSSLSAQSNGNGLVVECGDGLTQVVPIYQNQPIKESSLFINNLSGNLISNIIYQNILKNDQHLLDLEIINNIKEKFGNINININNNNNNNNNNNTIHSYKLPDGKTIEIKDNLINNSVEESIFKNGEDSIHQIINKSINLLPINNNNNYSELEIKNFYNNIILSGGTTMFPGFKERLKNELVNLINNNNNINIIAPENRNYSVFKGACMISSLSTFKSMCISKEEYNELG